MNEYMELIRELENMKYEDLTFSFNMPLRDFIQWVLNQPFYVILIAVLLIICSKMLFKFLYKDLTKNND